MPAGAEQPGLLFNLIPSTAEKKAVVGASAFVTAVGDHRRRTTDPRADLVPMQAAFTVARQRDFGAIKLIGIEDVTIDGAPAKRGTYEHQLKGASMRARFYLISHARFGMVIAAHAPVESFSKLEPEFDAMIATLRWVDVPPPASMPDDPDWQTVTSDTLKLRFEIPNRCRVDEAASSGDSAGALRVAGIDNQSTTLTLFRGEEMIAPADVAKHLTQVIDVHRKAGQKNGKVLEDEEFPVPAGPGHLLELQNEVEGITMRVSVVAFILNGREYKWVLAGQNDAVEAVRDEFFRIAGSVEGAGQ